MGKITSLLSRLHVLLAFEGRIGKWPTIAKEGLKRTFGTRLTTENIVYRADEDAYRAGPSVVVPQGFTVIPYDAPSSVPENIFIGVEAYEAADLRKLLRDEFASGGVLWIGYIDGEFAAFRWTIRARHLKRWYVALEPDDVVVYAGRTRHLFRGRGIQPAFFRHIIEALQDSRTTIYCDAEKWHTVTQRNIQRAGFRPIATRRRLRIGPGWSPAARESGPSRPA